MWFGRSGGNIPGNQKVILFGKLLVKLVRDECFQSRFIQLDRNLFSIAKVPI